MRFMAALVGVLIVSATLAGCLDREGVELGTSDSGSDEVGEAVHEGEGRLAEATLVAEYARGLAGGFEFSACMGEGPDVTRTGALVANGSRAFRITIEAGATTGVRGGVTLEQDATVWTAVVPAGQTAVFELPIDPDGWEPTRERWTFHYQPNTPEPTTQSCYMGASVGGLRVAFEAIP